MKGLFITENAMGFTAIRLHYTADPEKDPDHPDPQVAERAGRWRDAQKALWPDPNDFEREFEINFHVGKGARVFKQFSETYHARGLEARRHKVVLRSWDFGWHAPVCLVAQVDPKERLLLLKEIVGRQEDTRAFASRVLERCAEWFPQHAAGYEDYCDPAGQQIKSMESERNERRDVEVLASLGIHPSYEWGWSRKDGRVLVHRLLQLRTDGTPGLWVDPTGCPTLLQAFLGRYIYPETRDGKVKDEPDDDTHPWADVMAALRYLVTGVHRKLGLPYARVMTPATPVAPPSYHGYGTPVKATRYG